MDDLRREILVALLKGEEGNRISSHDHIKFKMKIYFLQLDFLHLEHPSEGRAWVEIGSMIGEGLVEAPGEGYDITEKGRNFLYRHYRDHYNIVMEIIDDYETVTYFVPGVGFVKSDKMVIKPGKDSRIGNFLFKNT